MTRHAFNSAEFLSKKHPWIRAYGPASLSNLGPGFDTLGLCIDTFFDEVAVQVCEEPGIHIHRIDNTPNPISSDPTQNTAAVAAQFVLDSVHFAGGLCMNITKGIVAGSGIGSSAASAVAGAWAANKALGTPLSKDELVDAVLEGEKVASGAYHGDNVLPALFGNLILVSANDPHKYRMVPIRKSPFLVVVQPDFQILTKQAREILPESVGLWDAVQNASELAFMLDAFHHGDWETLGRGIMQDRLVEPVRSRLLPCYEELKSRALKNGALGCALTGSGPAMFAVCASDHDAERVLSALLEPNEAHISVTGSSVLVNAQGVE